MLAADSPASRSAPYVVIAIAIRSVLDLDAMIRDEQSLISVFLNIDPGLFFYFINTFSAIPAATPISQRTPRTFKYRSMH
jgi:hypothetical protein